MRKEGPRMDGVILHPLLEKCAYSVGSASLGAVTHSGNVVWPEERVND